MGKYRNVKRREEREAREESEELAAKKLAIHATERVFTLLIEKSFDYQKAVDTLLVSSLVSENQDGAEKLQQVLNFQTQTIAALMGQAMTLGRELILNQQNQFHEREMARMGFEESESSEEDDSPADSFSKYKKAE